MKGDDRERERLKRRLALALEGAVERHGLAEWVEKEGWRIHLDPAKSFAIAEEILDQLRLGNDAFTGSESLCRLKSGKTFHAARCSIAVRDDCTATSVRLLAEWAVTEGKLPD